MRLYSFQYQQAVDAINALGDDSMMFSDYSKSHLYNAVKAAFPVIMKQFVVNMKVSACVGQKSFADRYGERTKDIADLYQCWGRG